MGAFALVAMLGFGLLATVFVDTDDASDESEDDTPETPETPVDPVDPEEPAEPSPEPVEGKTLILEGAMTITGTEGADTLTAVADSLEEQALFDETQQIDLLGGDDVVTIRNDMHVEINAGDGDDLIESLGLGITINGDAGNDTIYAGSVDHAYGGEGDDKLIYRGDTHLINSVAELEGGEGNDHLVGYEEVGAARTPYDSDTKGGYGLWGGEGADVFELKIDIVDYDAPDAPEIVRDSTNSIRDFEPGEDSLIIDLGEEVRTLVSSEVVKTTSTWAGQTVESSRLILTFAATDTEPQVEFTVPFSNPNVTLDDIAILSSSTAGSSLQI